VAVVGSVTRPDVEVVLCVNLGSSSVKGAVYEVGAGTERRVAAATVDHAGIDAVDQTLAQLAAWDDQLTAIGHRVVHGGPHLCEPTRVDAAVLADLHDAIPFAPLHLPAALEAIESLSRRRPQLPQVVCFDTGFHRSMPESARRLAVPRALHDAGVRRYGFHGLSYEYVVATLGAETLGRAVFAHLGNGASLAAVRDGSSQHTTMGLTPTGGIVMGTRSGDLDPGVLVYLAREAGYDPARLEALVDTESGLLGLSGVSADMRTLLERRADGDPACALAIEVFCTRIRVQVGAYAALLGGLDTLVFTGGIGAPAAPVRAEACAGLEHLGVVLDPARNDRHDPIVSGAGGPVTVRVVETDEDVMVARHTRAVVAA
jgi:acetate kinase